MNSLRRKPEPSRRRETLLLFSVGPHQLGISASALQEIRSDPGGNSGASADMPIVPAHVTLETGKGSGVGLLLLRQSPVAVRVDKMERIIEVSALHPLPQAFLGRERQWYRGLALVHDDVVPVLDPEAFLRGHAGSASSAAPAEGFGLESGQIPAPRVPLAGRRTVVIFPLGAKRYALSVDVVAQLSRPGWVQIFPHTTPGLVGVLVRRGRILPVWDIMPLLAGSEAPADKFYLVARRSLPQGEEWTAIPVSGECRMVQDEIVPPSEDAPAYVQGVVGLDGERVELLDLEQLAQAQIRAGGFFRPAGEGRQGVL